MGQDVLPHDIDAYVRQLRGPSNMTRHQEEEEGNWRVYVIKLVEGEVRRTAGGRAGVETRDETELSGC